MIRTYAAGITGGCSELAGRFSAASDVEDLYARFCARFPQLADITSRVAAREAGPETIIRFVGRTYRTADPALDAIPPVTETGFDTWCPRDPGGGLKYFDRVPLNAMIRTGYFNCLYPTALTARALTGTRQGFSLLTCPAVPTHPYIQLAGPRRELYSFHHDGLRCYHGHVEIRDCRYTPQSLTPITEYGPEDGIYGLTVPEHFLVLTRLVPEAGNIEQAAAAFSDLAARLDRYPRLEQLAAVIRLRIIPRLRTGPVPFTTTIEATKTTARANVLCGYSASTGGSTTRQRRSSTGTAQCSRSPKRNATAGSSTPGTRCPARRSRAACGPAASPGAIWT